MSIKPCKEGKIRNANYRCVNDPILKKLRPKTISKLITREHCNEWLKDNTRNPLTNRKIKSDGPIARELNSICSINAHDCEAFMANPLVTRKKLTKGLFAQLNAICIKSNATEKSKTPVKTPNHDRKIANLIRVLRKNIGPIIHKTDTTESRINFYNIINNYLKNLQPCLKLNNKDLVLFNDKKQAIINFDKCIGTESNYGIAYLNKGAGFGRMLKFSCKLMSADVEDHRYEVEILKDLTNVVLNNKFIHFPIAYKIMKCDLPCKFKQCPSVLDKSKYFIVINELADGDTIHWFKTKHTDVEYESILMQIIVAIQFLNSMGYQHRDLHLGNFLIHTIKPGGYWYYKLNNDDIYIPNTGYLLVLWDFGMTHKLGGKLEPYLDYFRAINLITRMRIVYKDYHLIPVSASMQNNILKPLDTYISTKLIKKDALIPFIIHNIPFNHIIFNKANVQNVINLIPHKLN